MIPIIKAASLVEYNAKTYAEYLKNVFHDNAEFQSQADIWAEEEVQHGQVLRRWAELADPEFNFELSFKRFIEGLYASAGKRRGIHSRGRAPAS